MALSQGGGDGDPPATPPPDLPVAEIGQEPSCAPIEAATVEPAPGSLLREAPQSVILEFDRPIDPTSLSFDVAIVHIGADGSLLSWIVPDQFTLDPSGTRLTVSPGMPSISGYYQVWILGGSEITDLQGNPLITDGENLVLGDFTISVPGITLSDAVDLGTVGSNELDLPGYLDFSANPFAVSLFRITLAPGHFWRLGVEVTAQRDGGSLDTALALFDDSGRLIASDDLGRMDAPQDPYLFAGIPPGSYYVGVSGVGNLPGTQAGYNPLTGDPGMVPQSQGGGSYTLHAVADAVDTPPQLISFTVDDAAPADSTPTGLTLGFSRAISRVGPLANQPSTLNTSIEVVDDSGRSWPVWAIAYDEAGARISYLFDDVLPPGHYTVRLPEQGGLVDLAGLSPFAVGQPPGVLGSFNVQAQGTPLDPYDLGSLFPALALKGVPINLTLGAGEARIYHVFVTVRGTYQLLSQPSEDSPTVIVSGGGLTRPIDLTAANLVRLTPGRYSFLFQAPPGRAVQSQVLLEAAWIERELLPANGVGQGPALALRLITPTNSGASHVPPQESATGSGPPYPSLTPAIFPEPSAPNAPRPVNRISNLTYHHAWEGLGETRTQSFRVGTLSFLDLGSDLVGRPSGHLYHVTNASDLDSTPLFAYAPPYLPHVTHLLKNPEPLAGDITTPLLRPEVVSRVVNAHGVPTALGIIGPEISRAIEIIGSVRKWALRFEAEVSELVESWFASDPKPDPSTPAIASFLPNPSFDRHIFDPDRDRENDDGEAGAWTGRFTPPMVVLSAALLGQLGRLLMGRWKSSKPGRGGIASKQVAHGPQPRHEPDSPRKTYWSHG